MHRNDQESHHCRVCGLIHDPQPWGTDGNSPIFEICVCCGVEFGYEDCMLSSVRKYRENWLKQGCKWFDPKEKPLNWSLEKQMENIPNEFR